MDFTLPLMRLLDRYLLRELLVPFVYCLVGFLIFWISVDLLSQLSRFQESHLHLADVLRFYGVTAPEMLVVVLPIAFLLALLYALTQHARHQELTAMRAVGISLWRLSLPYFGVGLFLSLALFAINELLVPRSSEAAEEILNRYTKSGRDNSRDWQRPFFFQNARDNRFWSATAYNLKTRELLKPYIICQLPGNTRREISAERGLYTNRVWTFFNVQETISSPKNKWPLRSQTNRLALLEFSETPALIRSEIKITNLTLSQAAKRPQLSIEEILDYFQLHPRMAELQHAALETQLHGRIAAPWTCLVVVLMAIPFGAPSGRRNVFVGVASSIFICFVYFILLRLGLALGTGGYVTPWLAAWLPNIFFGAAGIFLTMRVR
ncbi:MAG: LptF/LptG family permease [Verrucomicrobiota bacterium]|nr:LptF/LptG family permease [Verrucomicrobiota bacterium]